jgi:uncharacterized protein YggE
MNRKLGRLGISVFLLAGTAAFTASAALAQPDGAREPRTLSVTGEGSAKAVPDEAELSAGVVSQAPDANAALAANRRAMNAVFAQLKAQGIPDREIQTSDFTVSPQYDSGKDGNGPQRIVGYQVSNNVSVTVDDLAKLGSAIDALVGSGANTLGGVNFTLRDPKPMLQQARAAAVKDAMERAETYASAAGLTLGPVLQIGEGGAEVARPMFRAMALAASAPTPIAAGEQSVSASVSMTFEIR